MSFSDGVERRPGEDPLTVPEEWRVQRLTLGQKVLRRLETVLPVFQSDPSSRFIGFHFANSPGNSFVVAATPIDRSGERQADL